MDFAPALKKGNDLFNILICIEDLSKFVLLDILRIVVLPRSPTGLEVGMPSRVVVSNSMHGGISCHFVFLLVSVSP